MSVVYGILDPDTNGIVYVGETSKSILGRLFQHLASAHLNDCRSFNSEFSVWLRSKILEGKIPKIEILEQFDHDDRSKRLIAENMWIQKYRSLGLKLFNADRSEVNRRWWANKTTEERSAHAKKVHAGTTAEQRSAIAKKRWANTTPEQRSEFARRREERKTVAQKRASALKQWETKRAQGSK